MAKASSSTPLSAAPTPARDGLLDAIGFWLSGRYGKRAEKRFRVRLVVQLLFATACVVMGMQFARFVQAAGAGALPLPARPAGVEAFLPISGLMGLADWFYRGSLNTVHPAATVLVLVAIAMALIFRKAFCSWLCPVGLVSEWLARLGRMAFGRNFRPWHWADVLLRGLKYALMAFFVFAVIRMDGAALLSFLESPYNRVADVKMGLFFTEMGTVGLAVMGVLVIGSVFVQAFWCRYLCPYGALLGLFSWFSPSRVTRNATACVDCALCDKACPSRLPVASSVQIASPDCSGCLDCVAACPVKDALYVQIARRRVGPLAYAAGIVGLFLAGYVGARATGVWSNGMSDREYVERIQSIHTSEYGHPGG